jgi:hypothetical protein
MHCVNDEVDLGSAALYHVWGIEQKQRSEADVGGIAYRQLGSGRCHRARNIADENRL